MNGVEDGWWRVIPIADEISEEMENALNDLSPLDHPLKAESDLNKMVEEGRITGLQATRCYKIFKAAKRHLTK